MRFILPLSASLLFGMPAHAQVLECEGFALGYALFKCRPISAPAAKAASFCDVMNRQGGAVRWSRADTDATKDRADLINAAGKRLCGWKGK